MKQQVIAMEMYHGPISLHDGTVNLILPEGCVGMLFCFESKKTARKFWGKDVGLEECKNCESPEA